MLAQTTADNVSQTAQVIAYAVVGGVAFVGTLFAQRAAKRGRENKEALEVPNGVGVPRAPGPVLGKLEDEIAKLERTIDSLAQKVEAMQVNFAEHRGQHEGMVRDLDRVMRRVFNGERREKDQ